MSSAEKSASQNRAGSIYLVVVFLLCFSAFALFTEKLSGQELVLAGLSSTLVAGFACLLIKDAPHLRFTTRDVIQGWRVPFYIVQRVGQVMWLLILDLIGKRAGSLYRYCGYMGQPTSPHEAARRVLATAYTTAAPNFIVLEIDAKRHRLHFQQLSRTDISPMTQSLGAQP
jgi:hypothetical protein